MTASLYPLCDNSTEAYRLWNDLRCGRVTPDEHQQRLIDTVAAKIEAGVFYTSDMLRAVIDDLSPYLTEEMIQRGRGHVEGGVFGMEVYYARDLLRLRAASKHYAEVEKKLDLHVDDNLGSLVFNDYKLTTKCKVDSIDGCKISLTGKRGAYVVKFTTDHVGIDNAMDRAYTRGKRKTASKVTK